VIALVAFMLLDNVHGKNTADVGFADPQSAIRIPQQPS
jgi:hypothetical protein